METIGKFWIKKYGETRYFGVYDGNKLICVCVYKRGAREVVRRLRELEDEIEMLKMRCEKKPGIEPPVECGFKYD